MFRRTRELLERAASYCGSEPSDRNLFREAQVTCWQDEDGEYREGVIVRRFDWACRVVEDDDDLALIVTAERAYRAACRTDTASS